jgi:prepilin-type processing-associated H-X9-DG protein
LAARVACLNNLRQLATALHNFHGDHNRLPRKPRGGARPATLTTPDDLLAWMAHILPYVEEDSLWTSSVSACASAPRPWENPPHVGLSTVVKLYVCPLDGRLTRPLRDADGITAAYTSYVGVVGGRDIDGVMVGGLNFAQVYDGLSNTLMIGERPPPDTLQVGLWYPDLWFGTGAYGTLRGPNSGVLAESPGVYNDPCQGPFRFGPGRTDNPCDRWHFWSLHPQGANFAFADGSVRYVPYRARQTMVPLSTRAGGEALGEFE